MKIKKNQYHEISCFRFTVLNENALDLCTGVFLGSGEYFQEFPTSEIIVNQNTAFVYYEIGSGCFDSYPGLSSGDLPTYLLELMVEEIEIS